MQSNLPHGRGLWAGPHLLMTANSDPRDGLPGVQRRDLALALQLLIQDDAAIGQRHELVYVRQALALGLRPGGRDAELCQRGACELQATADEGLQPRARLGIVLFFREVG